jgi:threonine aldolase
MNFASDNVTGMAPEILQAIAAANEPAAAMPYGDDDISRGLDALFGGIFEADCQVFPVATGTAANALSLSILSPPYGAIYGLAHSHTNEDECGAPEFYTGGAKLVPIRGENGKLTRATFDATLADQGPAQGVHVVQPAAVSVTQATEMGTVYAPDEMAEICAFARANDLYVHVDGSRFANAVASLGCRPAELTVGAGVDIMSFGATKNGALAAEAVVIFNPELGESLGFRRKRGGHLFSKMRFLSAQLEAYLTDGLWLKLAGHANAMAERLADGLSDLDEVEVSFPVEANMIFARFPIGLVEQLYDVGFVFHHWGDPDWPTVRLVTAFNTDPDHVDRFIDAAHAHGTGA